MSLLQLIESKDDRENLVLMSMCATLIHITRFTSLSLLTYDVPCICKSPAKAREISLQTQLVYAIIYFLEMVQCLVVKITTPIQFITVMLSFMYLLMTFIISYGVCIVKTTDDSSEDSSEDVPEDSSDSLEDEWLYAPKEWSGKFSYCFLALLIGSSFVSSTAMSRNEREFVPNFNTCLNLFALMPQFCVFLRVKTATLSVRFFIFGMIIQTLLLLPGMIDRYFILGLEAEKYSLILVGFTLIIDLVCFSTFYPWKVVAPVNNDNQQNGEVQMNGERIEMADFPPDVIIHDEQRRENIAAGNDNNPDGINEENRDVAETKKGVDFQPDVAGEQSVSNSTNASAGATKEIKQADLKEENYDGTETTKMIDPQLEVAGVQSNSKATNSGAGAADDNEEAGRNEDNQGIRETRL